MIYDFYACTAKSFDVMKVNSALVKSVYFVTEYTICILVVHSA